MALSKPASEFTDEEKRLHAEHLTRAEQYGEPRRVWVEDGYVFAEGHDGRTLSMTPEVAINLGRRLSEAGSDSLINRVISESARATEASAPRAQ